MKAVKGLKNIEILKSYLLLVWSEWDAIGDGFDEMCALLYEDFSGVEMGHHQVDLIQQLDHILGQLDQGLEYLMQYNPHLDGEDPHFMAQQYRKLKEVLQEVQRRMYFLMIPLLCTLTPVEICRISYSIHVCSSSPMPISLG